MSGDKEKNKEAYPKKESNWLELLWKIKKGSTYKKNLDTFKLLTTFNDFQDEVKKIRGQFDKFKTDDRTEYINFLTDSNREIRKKFNLPYNFKEALSIFIQTDKIELNSIPARNYDFRFSPRPTIDDEGKIDNPVDSVHLITYTKLTNQEIKDATSLLKKIQHASFPKTKLYDRLKPHRDIDTELRIEALSKRRGRSKKKEEFEDFYLDIQKKKFETGKLSPKEWHKILLQNKKSIQTKKIKSYTSEKIIKETGFHIKPNTLTHIIKRLEKERKNRFINNEDKK
jgi:hypothetical protein